MILTLALLACAPRPAPGPSVGLPERPGHLTILHTNDLHGHFLPEAAEWLPGRPAIGGMVRLEQEARSIRAQRPRDGVLMLDGGDLLTGTPLTDIEVDGAKGGAMMRLLGAAGYDLWVVGNHDFDKGLENLIALAKASPIPMLTANVRAPDGRMLLPKQRASEVIEVGGMRVGVIGATTDGLKGLVSAKDFARLQLLKSADAVRAEVKRLDPETDLIVLLSHVGLDQDKELARWVPGIDVIVGGHSHTRLTRAERVNDTWIVQAGSYGRSLGVVDLVVENDAVGDFRYELRDLHLDQPVTLADGSPVREDADLAAMVGGWKDDLDSYYGKVVSTAPALLGRSYHHESALGRWITDALRITAEADVTFYNGGGLRSDLPAGQVTHGTLYNCFPFANEIKVFDFTGEELNGVFLRNALAEHDEKRGFLSLSGATYRWRVVNGSPEIVDLQVGGKPLALDGRYRIATTSYIAEQWQKHFGVEPRDVVTMPLTDFDAAVAMAKAGPVVAPDEARAVKVD